MFLLGDIHRFIDPIAIFFRKFNRMIFLHPNGRGKILQSGGSIGFRLVKKSKSFPGADFEYHGTIWSLHVFMEELWTKNREDWDFLIFFRQHIY